MEVVMNRFCVRLLMAFLSFALAGGMAWAQATTAQISGTVKDQSGVRPEQIAVAVRERLEQIISAGNSTAQNIPGNRQRRCLLE